MTFLPRGDFLCISFPWEGNEAAVDVFVFNTAFHFKLLNEMAVPVKAAFECSERSIRAESALSCTKRLKHLPDAQVAPGNVGREA